MPKREESADVGVGIADETDVDDCGAVAENGERSLPSLINDIHSVRRLCSNFQRVQTAARLTRRVYSIEALDWSCHQPLETAQDAKFSILHVTFLLPRRVGRPASR